MGVLAIGAAHPATVRNMMKARVFITLKNGVLDPQGKAIHHALEGLGFAGVNDVRAGKLIELERRHRALRIDRKIVAAVFQGLGAKVDASCVMGEADLVKQDMRRLAARAWRIIELHVPFLQWPLSRSFTSGSSSPAASSPLDVTLLSSGGRVSMSASGGSAPAATFSLTAMVSLSGALGCSLWQEASATMSEPLIQIKRGMAVQQPWWASCCTAALSPTGF